MKYLFDPLLTACVDKVTSSIGMHKLPNFRWTVVSSTTVTIRFLDDALASTEHDKLHGKAILLDWAVSFLPDHFPTRFSGSRFAVGRINQIVLPK